eukprot:TRINITY_DN2912_c0_g1_i1.p1 TRINITY_DN2912_c0_g1~~TRINITY_DN2912_c0_g1_i1.p1  ORF type:complete len:204 (-),score=26.95 TRINITY_DN2912_c0_g1_i1:37-648(-)
MNEIGPGPTGPWTKDYSVRPLQTKKDSYYSVTCSPGHILKDQSGKYIQFFSAATQIPPTWANRTIGIARTDDLNKEWIPDPEPILPLGEQVENIHLYFEETNGYWFLFTNHVGISDEMVEYTDALWVYWSRDINKWRAKDKALVLDHSNSKTGSKVIGLPTVVKVGNKLAILYDLPVSDPTSLSHMKRGIGLAYLPLPLSPPS